MEFDLHSRIKAVHALLAQVHIDASTNGATIDSLGFESCEYIAQVSLAIDGDFEITLEQAPDDGTGSPGAWAAVPAADVLGVGPIVIATADAAKVYRLGSVGKERFQRCVLVETAANTVGVVGVIAVLSNPSVGPAAEQIT